MEYNGMKANQKFESHINMIDMTKKEEYKTN